MISTKHKIFSKLSIPNRAARYHFLIRVWRIRLKYFKEVPFSAEHCNHYFHHMYIRFPYQIFRTINFINLEIFKRKEILDCKKTMIITIVFFILMIVGIAALDVYF